MSSVFSFDLMDVVCIWLIAVVIITQKVSQNKLFAQIFELLGNFLICGGWLGKKAQNQEIALMGRGREASRLGKKVRNREKTPMGRVREAS